MQASVGPTGAYAIVDHASLEVGEELRTLENDGLWVAHRNRQRSRALTGSAWVTFGGGDYVLDQGDRLELFPGRDPAAVSAVGPGLTILRVA
jgi:hypothetical protein